MVDYGKWDKFAAALDDASVERCPPAPPWVADDTAGGDGTDPTDPTRVAAMRNLLDEIDDARRPHLEAAIAWLERASACFAHGEAPSDGDCPFNQGDEAWFWFCLLANKPHVTLHGPYRPLLARHRSAKEQCFAEGLVCARCFAAGGGHYWGRRPLKRCSACRAASYCGRDCQRLDLDAHKADCRAGKESEIPNFKGSYLGRFPLVSADFWTSDHLSERSRSMDAFPGTRARGTLTLKRR